MAQSGKDWFRKHRSSIGAIVFTVAIALAVFFGKLEAGRALVAEIFCVMLALHSRDINDHKEEVLEGFQQAERAGILARAGQTDAALDAAENAAKIAAHVAEEVEADQLHNQEASA